MERESFEDDDVAKILNKHFISIKVDKEERPDIDHIYMTICQAMTGHGGWPLTVIMAPDKKPFFAGTYFPKKSRGHMPGLVDILNQVARLWSGDRKRLTESGDQVFHAVHSQLAGENPGELSEAEIKQGFRELQQSFDKKYGGFNTAPKFPTPHVLSFLLRYWKVHRDENALEMVEKTLQSMFLGGIYDHIGGGFSRYSTDRQWLVPHFEKMLYDNALLSIAYTETFQVTGNLVYRNIAEEILNYILRDMASPEGGFYSAEDADSEGVEGKFYVWTPEEVNTVLGEESRLRFGKTYDITPRGNFEGKNIPNLIKSETPWEAQKTFAPERSCLLLDREKRIHPFKDDKILTSWNGLMIAAMSIAGRVFDKTSFTDAAAKAADFLLTHLRRSDGRLLARYRMGEARHLAYLDDYAFLTWGLIELYETTFKPVYLQEALKLSLDLVKYFWDETGGGCCIYGSDGEQLLSRPKEIYDGATPSGNSVTALNFLRLSRLTGDANWEEKARRIFSVFGGSVKVHPSAYCHLLMALQFATNPGHEVILSGIDLENRQETFINTVQKEFLPNTVVVLTDRGLEETVPFMKDLKPVDNKPTAYVCTGFSCQAPITDVKQFRETLSLN